MTPPNHCFRPVHSSHIEFGSSQRFINKRLHAVVQRRQCFNGKVCAVKKFEEKKKDKRKMSELYFILVPNVSVIFGINLRK